jgi:hypothetical protein
MSYSPTHVRRVVATIAALALAVCFAPRAEAAPQRAAKRAAGFTLSFGPAAPKHKDIRAVLEGSGRFQDAVAELNASFALPRSVKIVFREGEGPQYDPNTGEIAMNYDFAARAAVIFAGEGASDDDIIAGLLGAVEFVLYHEVGHALVDVCELPVTGKEEDAVDGLATFIAVLTEREEIAVAGAALFEAWAANREEFSEEDFWDEHSLDEQRTFSILCWVYGSNPEAFASLAKEAQMPKSRAKRCESEYQQIAVSWSKLLLPHLRE